MRYFELTDSLFAITEKYPRTKSVFIANGFSQIADEQKRLTFGKALQLDIALAMRQLDQDAFIQLLEDAITAQDTVGVKQKRGANELRMKGLLPCPVRLPLQEQLDAFLELKAGQGIQIHAELKAASMGLDWMKDEAEAAAEADEVDDLYLSAGFDMFFEEKYFGRFIQQGVFADPIRWTSINSDFDNDLIQLKDPKSRYGIIAVVPAVFLVNTNELGDRPVPQCWKDLCDPVYHRSVSLPVSDFDLFNAILLTIDQVYGRDAVRSLGHNMQQSMHPAQMVKSERQKTAKPAITIMPNFFTKMVREGSAMKAVWPADGAIISPVFMIAKTNRSEHLQDLADLIASKEAAEVLAHMGLFPSLHPGVENRLPEGAKFMWLGWDYIEQHNLNQRFAECYEVFQEAFSKE